MRSSITIFAASSKVIIVKTSIRPSKIPLIHERLFRDVWYSVIEGLLFGIESIIIFQVVTCHRAMRFITR